MKGYPYAFHIALDGNGINGLEGMAGVCLFLFDPVGNRHAYKIVYFDGIAGGSCRVGQSIRHGGLSRQCRPASAVL